MKEVPCFSSDLIEVFKTEKGVVYQSDRESCLMVDFGGKIARFSFACFSRLKNRVNEVDLALMLNEVHHPDFELITIAACEHCYLLSAIDIHHFRELINGTFVMFELNHIIKDRLSRLVC